MPDNKLRIPYENIVYIGDSATDIPCMRLVKSKGGFSVGVYDPDKDERARVYQLFNDNRLSFYAPADYSPRAQLSKIMKQIIDEVATREVLKTERNVLQQPAELYKMYSTMQNIPTDLSSQLKPKEKKELNSTLEEIEKIIPGKIKK